MLSLLSSRGSKAQRAAARASPLVQPHKDKYTDLSIMQTVCRKINFMPFAEVKDELPCLETSLLAYSLHDKETGADTLILNIVTS